MNYREYLFDDKELHAWLTLRLLNHGIHRQQGGYISAITEDAHLDQTLSLVQEGLIAVRE